MLLIARLSAPVNVSNRQITPALASANSIVAAVAERRVSPFGKIACGTSAILEMLGVDAVRFARQIEKESGGAVAVVIEALPAAKAYTLGETGVMPVRPVTSGIVASSRALLEEGKDGSMR